MSRLRTRPLRARPAATALCALLLALAVCPGLAHATVPPVPTCMYWVAGCDPIYGTGVSVGPAKIVEQGSVVRLSSGLEAPIPWDQPINPSCVGSIGQTCIYWSIAWKIEPSLGLSPISQQAGCGGNDADCQFVYTRRGVGIDGDVWQPVVAALQSGQTPTRKVGFLVYARPKWRWVSVTAPGFNGYTPLTAYAVKSGTNPAYGSCLDANAVDSMVVPAGLECVKISGRGGSSSSSPSWRMPLPSQSGGWTIYPGLYPRGEAGPATTAGKRFGTVTAALADDDVELTTSPLPVPALNVQIDTGGDQLGLGVARTVTVTARAVGGQAPLTGVQWYLNVITRSGSATKVTDQNAPSPAVLMPGESISATATITGINYGTDTFNSRVQGRDVRGDDVYGSATPVTVTVARSTPPPPGGGSGGGRPRPPVPVAAAGTAVSGHVDDQKRVTYSVSWYAAASCGASDGDARLLGARDVTTGGDGIGDAAIVAAVAARDGEAVFGYSALGGVRSDRSACVTARSGAAGAPAPGGGGAIPGVPGLGGGGGRVAAAPPRAAALKASFSAGRPHAGRAFTLAVRLLRGSAAVSGGTVTIRRGRRTLAGPAKVSRGVARVRLRLPRGRQRLTLVYQASKRAKAVTSSFTVTVGR